jgi:hypothetical protein
MADLWQTYAFEFKGGLLSSLSPLQQGINAPGSARLLKNFEPSTDGGYRRIEGFSKYDSAFVPAYGLPKVHGSGQTGTALVLGNIFTAPVAGDTLTIAGVTGTYTIASAGVSYDSTNKRVTLTLTTSMASSPADKAAVTFTSHTGVVNGVATWESTVIAYRNNDVYKSTGSGWTKINIPSYGTVLVNGAGQTGSSLAVDGLTDVPQVGDTFSIAGVEKIYTVTATPTVTSGGATLAINPALASSPADNAAVTWLSVNYTGGIKLRTAKYRTNSVDKIVGVNGTNYPFIWDDTTFTSLDTNTDLLGADFVVFHKNQLFFVNEDKLIFSAPYTDTDFTAANGAGVISVGAIITGIIVFREALIIFTDKSISQLAGNTVSDFNLQPITRNVGCVASDTIQEIGGDIMFLGPEGLRLLSATDRTGDFNLGVVSKPIQAEATELISSSSSFASVVIKQKSQYRLLGYNASVTTESAKGILGTQMVGDNTSTISWAETVGIKAYVADSNYINQTETIIFAHSDGYVYQMESGNSFDGTNILASFATPYVPVNDPRIRKTFYKLFLYTDPQGSVNMSANLKLDFDDFGSIQPETISLSNVNSSSVGFYGTSTAKYGATKYGTKLKKLFQTQVIGSGFSVSLQFVSDGTDPPFSLDAATLEYSNHDRR